MYKEGDIVRCVVSNGSLDPFGGTVQEYLTINKLYRIDRVYDDGAEEDRGYRISPLTPDSARYAGYVNVPAYVVGDL